MYSLTSHDINQTLYLQRSFLEKQEGSMAADEASTFKSSPINTLNSHSSPHSNAIMPSRKNESGDGPTASRRGSLRRLSSIASFQTLFMRRRSHNHTDPTANSSTSNLSLTSSTVANAPEPVIPPNALNGPQNGITIAELPATPLQVQMPTRRSSYVCLPDDPIGGMPRSRTFSNLPLPTRTRKTAPLLPSKSHSRLPSSGLPSTRLPSPAMSNRRHSHTRLASVATNVPAVRNRMKRSDTEPLLGIKPQQRSTAPRSTAFKENITLSPIKPLPEMDMSGYDSHYGSSFSPTSYALRSAFNSTDDVHQPLLSNSLPPSTSLSSFADHPALRIVRGNKSSPAHRNPKDKPPTPGASKGMDISRTASQPVLTNTTNVVRQQWHSKEIKQTRLMSARQAPTPPPPKTPLPSLSVHESKAKSKNNAGQIRKSSSQSPTLPRSSSTKEPRSPKRSIHQVSHPESPSYWLGRLSALTDRYRNDELAALIPFPLSPSTPKSTTTCPPKSQTDKMHTPEASTARLLRAFEALEACCVTREARESLRRFRERYAAVVGDAGLECGKARIVLDGDADADVEGGEGGQDAGGEVGLGLGLGEGRKVGFMDRLLGRQRRSSVGFV